MCSVALSAPVPGFFGGDGPGQVKKTGLFDEEHFAYLEDMDIGYRGRLLGYENWFCPKARVLHVGSGTTGVACMKTGRNFIGYEKEKKYFDISQERIFAEKGKINKKSKLIQGDLFKP